jgi:hypothetical protein
MSQLGLQLPGRLNLLPKLQDVIEDSWVQISLRAKAQLNDDTQNHMYAFEHCGKLLLVRADGLVP